MVQHCAPLTPPCLPAPIMLPLLPPLLLLLLPGHHCRRNVTLAPVSIGLDLPPLYQALLDPYTRFKVGDGERAGCFWHWCRRVGLD